MGMDTMANQVLRLRPAPVEEHETPEAAYRRCYIQGASAFLEDAGAALPAGVHAALRAFLNGPVVRWRLKYVGLARVPPKARDERPPRFPERPMPPPPY